MNLFMLGAPYQFLNALEAIHHFGLEDNHLRIIDTGHFTRSQFERVIDSCTWSSVRFHDFRYKLVNRDFGRIRPRNLWEWTLERYLVFDQILKRLRAEHIAREIQPLNYLVLGNYQRDYDGHMRHFANRLKYQELILLDVGTDTLRINVDRQNDNVASTAFKTITSLTCSHGSLKERVKRAILDWDSRGVERLTFFTVYDLEPTGRDSVV